MTPRWCSGMAQRRLKRTLYAGIPDLAVIRDRIAAHVKAGMDLSDIIAAEPSKEFDARYGDNTMFINRVKSLTYRYHP